MALTKWLIFVLSKWAFSLAASQQTTFTNVRKHPHKLQSRRKTQERSPPLHSLVDTNHAQQTTYTHVHNGTTGTPRDPQAQTHDTHKRTTSARPHAYTSHTFTKLQWCSFSAATCAHVTSTCSFSFLGNVSVGSLARSSAAAQLADLGRHQVDSTCLGRRGRHSVDITPICVFLCWFSRFLFSRQLQEPQTPTLFTTLVKMLQPTAPTLLL